MNRNSGMNRPELDRKYTQRGSGKLSQERNVIFTIFIGEEKFGLPIYCVKTVFNATAITPVPLAPKSMIGLINLRGHVVTAICMRTSLGMPALQSQPDLMVALEHQGEGFALAVDRVGDVIEVVEENRIPLAATISPLRRNVTTAAYKTPDGIVPVLDIESLLGTSAAAA